MNEYLYFGAMVVVFAAQLVLCWKVKSRLLRLAPTLLIVLSMVGSGIAYALSGGTNWAFLILIALQFGVLVVDGLAWLLAVLVKWALKGREQ